MRATEKHKQYKCISVKEVKEMADKENKLKGWHILLILLGIGVAGAVAYFLLSRKAGAEKPVAPIPPTPEIPTPTPIPPAPIPPSAITYPVDLKIRIHSDIEPNPAVYYTNVGVSIPTIGYEAHGQTLKAKDTELQVTGSITGTELLSRVDVYYEDDYNRQLQTKTFWNVRRDGVIDVPIKLVKRRIGGGGIQPTAYQ
jgi:hypothetical protein